jgi:RNA methyltransferase, TrmH family
LASSFVTTTIFGTADFLKSLSVNAEVETVEVTERDLEALGEFQSNASGLALAKMKPNLPLEVQPGEYVLVLDDIRDPGNLGTIVRIADWYGIHKVIASEETADLYNAKVISASMGSFTRVDLYYTSLPAYLQHLTLPVYGAVLDGSDVHSEAFHAGGYLVIGNESRGISPEVLPYVSKRITIPRFGEAESLNAAIATAIICDNIRRKH